MNAGQGRFARRPAPPRCAVAALLAAALVGGCHRAGAPVVAPASPTGPAAPASSARPAHPAVPALPGVEALQHDIDQILLAPALERGYWGVLVKSLDTNDTLYAANARKLMMPASNMKIVTLAAAAARLGWDFQYATRLMAAGSIANGVLDGDLVVVGSGDPSITDAATPGLFASWAEELKARGITTIGGRIVADASALGDEPLGMGWSWDDLADGYAAGVGALQFDENMARVTIGPGPAPGTPAAITIAPAAAGLVVRNRVTTVAADGAESFETRRTPGSAALELRGSIPLGSVARVHTVSVDKPAQFFVAALKESLTRAGIDVRGPAVSVAGPGEAPAEAGLRLLLESRSPPLSALAVRMMKASQNQYAETLLLTLGGAAGSPTAKSGAASAASVLREWGVPPDGLIQRDGSGLSRYDYVSPDTLVTILAHVDGDAILRDPFESSLPIAGRDGTLANRMKGTAAEGNVRAKSGSMANVRTLSGYVTSAGGERLVFAILANNFDAGAEVVNAATDAIVVRLAQFTRSAQKR